MTVEKLAVMVARGFEKTATKDDLKILDVKLSNRLDDLDRKIDKVDFRVDQVHDILDGGEKDFLSLQRRAQVLEKGTKVVGTKI